MQLKTRNKMKFKKLDTMIKQVMKLKIKWIE
jgi:hypothetical protein